METPAREDAPDRRIPHACAPGVFLMTQDFQVGGSERQFVTVARSMNRDEFRVEAGCVRRSGPLLGEFTEIPEFPLGGSFLSRQSLRSRFSLARHLRSRKIAIAHSFDFYTNLFLIPTARWAGVKVVIGSQRQIGDLLTPMQFGLQSAVFRLCDRVVCNSQAAAMRLVDQGLPERKVAIIPNGIPDEVFAPALPAIPREPGMTRVGMLARMNNACKNHPLFLRAVASLARRHSNFEVLLIGDGPLRPSLERLARGLGLEHRVRFLGERHDIPALLASLDFTVLPSSTESLSNSIMESMAAGVPVIATAVGGNPELISDGETGLLVPADNEDRLAGAMERFLTVADLRAICGQQAKETAESKFRLGPNCRRFERLYEDALQEKNWSHSTQHVSSRQRDTGPVTRVAIVAASPRWIGGHGVQAELLMKGWHDDPEIQARFIPIDPEFPQALAWIEGIPIVRTVFRMPVYLWALWRAMKDVEIAHIFSASYWSFLLAPVPAWLVARLRGKQTLIHYHSGEARQHLSQWRTAMPILRRTDRLVVPSQYLVDVFREFGLEADAVPNLIDPDQFSFRPRRPLRPRLLCTRGFGRYYSVDVVVRAYAGVKEKFPDARLCLVGGGEMETEIRDLAAQLKLADVEFAGPVSRSSIGSYYDRSDIFINASWLDNMPVSILEAFASGTPVVSTAPEGIRYLVEHERTGLLSPPGDWKALGENVMRVLRDSELADRLTQNAFEECARYRWEAVRGQWLEVYGAMRCGSSLRADLPEAETVSTGIRRDREPISVMKKNISSI